MIIEIPLRSTNNSYSSDPPLVKYFESFKNTGGKYDIDKIKQLIKECPDINKTFNDGYRSIIGTACAKSYIGADVIKLLLEAGACANVVDRCMPPIHCITNWQDGNGLDKAKLLVEAGADITVRSTGHGLLYHIIICTKTSITKENQNFIKEIVKLGTDINAKDRDGGSLLWECDNNPKLIELLYSLGLNLNAIDEDGDTFLHEKTSFIGSKFTKDIKKLVELGVNLNIQNKDGNSILMVAIKDSRMDIVPTLLEFKKMDMNLQNKEGETALTMLLKSKSYTFGLGKEKTVISEIIREMFEQDADPYIKNAEKEDAFSLLKKKKFPAKQAEEKTKVEELFNQLPQKIDKQLTGIEWEDVHVL